ncbi:hypothetical protein LTR08_008170 [Meristemomyces frigidus]|nr:hypothetical protein LTR08_008170 [Meristemomyces frigidus]
MNTPEDVSGVSEEQSMQLVTAIKDYQLTHGNLIKWVQSEGVTRVPSVGVGVSALPTPFPRSLFDEAWQLQASMNELYVRIASDEDWLYGVLKPLFDHDDFLAALWDVHVTVKTAGVAQDIVCGIFRSDYMLHQPSTRESVSLKQVEVNTLCVAGACHAERVAGMHRHLQRKRDVRKPAEEQGAERLPVNDNIEQLVITLCKAHDAYTASPFVQRCVLMIVQAHNFNVADERPIEYGLWDSGIPCYRCEWQEVLQRTTLTASRKLLYRVNEAGVQAELEVSVVYYRAGYTADEYTEHEGRETRLRLELSCAIKCPDVLTHLTTFKAVQQALTEEGAVERFLSADDAHRVRATFMPIVKVDKVAEGQLFREIATDPRQASHFVLKPNLEGGGNNVYGTKIPDFLASIPDEQWSKYILMRLIVPPGDTSGVLMMMEELYEGPVISELGVLGSVVWKKEEGSEVEVVRNVAAGWTFKTKPSHVDEMNVVKGYGCFDCPKLAA